MGGQPPHPGSAPRQPHYQGPVPGYPPQYQAPSRPGYLPRPPKRNKGLIIAAVIGAGLLGASAFGAVVYRGVTDPHGRSEMDDLRAGRCVDKPSSAGTVYSLPTRSCDKPHDGEVVYVGHLTEWKNETAARDAGKTLCVTYATPIIEASTANAVVELMSYAPADKASYRKSTTVQCVAWATGGTKLTQSLTGK
ncbi:hypothetical protein [Nocardia sp. NPDC050717]|uniref:hypothetical protein n=1 Tax=Nocardia sp. NPDC050717 TaxID=3157221 RepID=UPI0033E9F2F7